MKIDQLKYRKQWTRHPATRVKPNDKAYRRCRAKQKIRIELKNIENNY